MPDFTCPNHPRREVAWRGDICYSCRIRRQEAWERQTNAKWLSHAAVWLAVLAGCVLLFFAASSAVATHLQIRWGIKEVVDYDR